MVSNDPSKATMDLENEEFGFSVYHQYEEKFDEEFDQCSIHDTSTCSNEKGWA